MTRLNFENASLKVSTPARERLERLREETDADSLSEVVRRALAVYEALLDQQGQDGELVVRYKDGSERAFVLI